MEPQFQRSYKMANVTEITSQDCQPNTSLNCYPCVEQEEYYSIPVSALYMFVGILALIFNSCIIVLIVKEKKTRLNPYHFLVLMLCASDFLVGLAFVFAILRQYLPGFKTSNAFAVLTTLLMTTGLYLSLFHTFLISLQRFLVICIAKWNSLIFHQNRKYFVCVSGWIVILISNCLFISSPPTSPDDDIVSYVFDGRNEAYTIYIRLLTMSLLFSSLTLYLVTIVYVLIIYKKGSPIGQSNALKVIKTIEIQIREPCPSKNRCNSSCLANQLKVIPMRLGVRHSNTIDARRRKKAISTLYVVGILITVLLIFTGPLVVTLSWFGTLSLRIKGILFGLCCINSTLNPFIYVWKLVDIREKVKAALFCFNK